MENVTCSIDIQLTDIEDRFGDGWDFKIDIYTFQKISDTRVRVTFTYEDEVNRIDEDGVMVSGHDSYSDRYVSVEEKLQTLLDLICFQKSGTGLRLVPYSREMKSSTMTSHRTQRTHDINLNDHEDIKVRFETTIKQNNEPLLDALRLNRLAASEENDAEKIGQLWGAVERLYASNPPKVLDSKEKLNEIQTLIDAATLIDEADKTRLKNRLNDTYKLSKPSIIAEKFNLIDGYGERMTEQEVKQKLDYWINTRSIQSHGVVLMRNQDVRMLAGEMEHILETALSGEVKPSKFVYFVYKLDHVEEAFLSSQRVSTKHDDNSGYSYTPLHKFAAFNDMSDRLRHSLKDDNSEMFLVDYHSITRVKRDGDETVGINDLHKKLSKLIKELQSKLN